MTFTYLLDSDGIAHHAAYTDAYGRFASCGREVTAATTVGSDYPAITCPGCFG